MNANSSERINEIYLWLTELGYELLSLELASADASFRRYFRVRLKNGPAASAIVMDAPPQHEPVADWLRVQALFADLGLVVPDCYAKDPKRGLLLIEDFGDTTLFKALQSSRSKAHQLYAEALGSLALLQRSQLPQGILPCYDAERLRAELELFPSYYIERYLAIPLGSDERMLLDNLFTELIARLLKQPQVIVHRDYHSRNLMLLAEDHPKRMHSAIGLLDFQDALKGPVTYDLVSLLKDAYIAWPEEFGLDLLIRYWQQARKLGIALPDRFDRFYLDFELMGVQRHLKVLGIFARLAYRDGKKAYLQHLGTVRRYLWQTLPRFGFLKPLYQLFARLHPEELRIVHSF